MAFFGFSHRIEAPIERVWPLLADWERQAEWMVDATTVEVLGDQREGIGTRVRAVTRVALGIPVTDTMVVTDWEHHRLIRVRHLGWLIRGDAWFILHQDGGATVLEWGEDLVPPFGVLGEIVGNLLRTPIERLLRASARRLAAIAESDA